jgi:gas vesicle protein
MSENSDRNVSGYLAALAIGALAGAGIALLLAPRSGKETRDALAGKARELKDRAEQVLVDAKEALAGKRAEVTAAVEAAKEAIREERAKQAKSA